MAGFHILKLTGAERARPFGQNRPGLSLGEGAAFLILEPKEKVSRENRRYYAELIGYGMTSDAYHMTAPSENGEGAVEVMKRSLEMAKLKPGEIDFINAHGTGTVMNDRTEATAIRSVFGENTPVASVKGLLGHTLGAAGAIEAVASIYSILKQKAFENFNSYQKGEDCDVNLVPRGGKTLKKAPVVLSNSFAFGGNNCTLIFKGVD
jgi:3-oxoacyl-(acyl-carrier-protein) synthase